MRKIVNYTVIWYGQNSEAEEDKMFGARGKQGHEKLVVKFGVQSFWWKFTLKTEKEWG